MLIKANKIDLSKSTFSNEEMQKIVEILEKQAEIHKKSSAPLHLQLKYSNGEIFAKKFDQYIRIAATKAVPSLFSTVKSLYENPEKVTIIEGIIVKHLESLKNNETFTDSTEPQDPTVYLWLLLFAANHFDQRRNYEKALEIIETAIEHTPTLVETYTCKARILKHMKNAEKAAETYEIARKIDQADRYLNARCSKYLIRAGKLEEAEKTMALFSREVDSKLNVHEMQCMWYENETGKAFEAKNQVGKAYKMFKYIETHFDTIYDDQFDYHYYALKRGNLNAYIKMIGWEDKLYSHKNFLIGALGLLRCYIKINELNQKSEKTEAEQAELKEVDDKNYMDNAVKLAEKAIKFHDKNIELHQNSAKIFMLKQKWVMAAKSIVFLKENKAELKNLDKEFIELCNIIVLLL